VLELIKNKKHLSLDGLKKIVAIRASWLRLKFIRGISDGLHTKESFPDIVLVSRPLVFDQTIKDSQ
jgi:hypothetical protein